MDKVANREVIKAGERAMYFKLLRTNLIIGMHGILAFIIKKNVNRSSGEYRSYRKRTVRAGLGTKNF